jgi:hypothetical protein
MSVTEQMDFKPEKRRNWSWRAYQGIVFKFAGLRNKWEAIGIELQHCISSGFGAGRQVSFEVISVSTQLLV